LRRAEARKALGADELIAFCLAFRHSRKEFVMYFKLHVVAKELRRKMLVDGSATVLGYFFLDCHAQ
jgi:hypothetical protein